MSTIADIMTRDVISISIDDDFKEAANVFDNIKIRHVPVMCIVAILHAACVCYRVHCTISIFGRHCLCPDM